MIRGRTWSRPICGIHGPKALGICHATGSRSWVCASDELPDEVPVKINACRSFDVFLLSKPNPVVEAVVEVVESTDDEGENPATHTACGNTMHKTSSMKAGQQTKLRYQVAVTRQQQKLLLHP